jgi:putative acetyltransferase
MNTPYQIQYAAFAAASGIYDERHAKLYAELADSLIEDGSFSIIYEGVAHACYTPIIIDKAPHLTCYVLAPISVLPDYQGKGYATRLMEKAEKQLGADAIFVLGDPKHYARRYDTAHKISLPVESNAPLECWFAREMKPDALSGIGISSSTISGPFASPVMWKEPSEQV